MTLVVNHSVSAGGVVDADALVDGAAWDANHVLTGTADASQLNASVVQAVTNDTNITGSISGQNLTFVWAGSLATTRGGTAITTYTLGDTLYASAANTLSKLAGNTTTAKQYLSQTGNGSVSAAPSWATIVGADITGAALTKTDDTNVTLTLGGSASTALLRAASITVGWTGTLANARLANMNAYTIKGNTTGSAAAPTDFTIGGLTQKVTPAGTDLVIIQDQAASGALKYATVTSLTGSSGVSSIAGNTGAFTLSHGLTNSTNDIQFDVSCARGRIAGLTLSTAGSSSTFSVSAGVAVDSTAADFMKLSSAISKTTSSWTVGTGNGSLASGETIANNTWYHVHEIKRTDTGVVDILTSQAPGPTSALPGTFTVTIASPGVITCTNHGLAVGAPFVPTTTGALPTGMTAGTTYYVKTVTDINTIGTFAATQGGSAINTTGSQSGTHTLTASPPLPANYTLFRRIGSMLTNGSAQWVLFKQYGDEFTWGVPPALDINTTTLSTSATSSALSVPIGINVEVLGNAYASRAAVQVGVLIWNPDLADQTLSESATPLTNLMVGTNAGTAIVGAAQVRIRTNTSSQIRYIAQSSSTTFRWATVSWFDTRGRFL